MSDHQLGRRDLLALAGLAAAGSSAGGRRRTSEARQQRGRDRRRELYSILGELPPRERPIGGKKRTEETRDGYVLETWDLDLNGLEPVPAYLARPRSVTGRIPAVLFNHSHGGGYKIGKLEFVDGRSYLQPVRWTNGSR